MILLDNDLKFRLTVLSENKAIKSHFKGSYYRSVPATVFDKTSSQIFVGVLYICAQNALLYLQTNSPSGQLYQLEATDIFRTIDQDNKMLKQAADARSAAQRFIAVRTSHPINFLELNSRYICIVDFIQPPYSDFGTITIASETIVVAKDFIEKNANLLKAIDAVVHGREFDVNMPLPGTDMRRSALIRYLPLVLIFLLFVAVIAGFVIIGTRPAPSAY